ncbi:MAG: hypothetical protein AB8B84_09770 [Granulosicoccus sp.]
MRTKTYLNRLLFISLVVLLSACDGGLFGTGDGSNTIQVETGADSNPPDSDTRDPDPDSNPSTDPVENPGTGDGNSAPPATQTPVDSSFENLQAGTNSTTPGIHLINVSDRSIGVFNESNGSNVFSNPIPPGSVSDAAAIQLGENNLVVTDTTNDTAIAYIRPLNAGTSTLTTLIVRNTTGESLDVVKLSSISISQTPTVARVRVVQANSFGTTDSEATFMLLPFGNNPGGSTVLFNNINSSSASEANYQLATPGGYRLVDSLGRFDDIPLDVGAGKIYTLIIQESATPPILVHEDDQLSF